MAYAQTGLLNQAKKEPILQTRGPSHGDVGYNVRTRDGMTEKKAM